MSFHGSTYVFVEGETEEDDFYAFRNELLLNEINKKTKE